MAFEQPAELFGIVLLNGAHELVCGITDFRRPGIDVGLELGPAGEAIFAGDHKLNAAQVDSGRRDLLVGQSREFGMAFPDARDRCGIAGFVCLEKRLGLAIELVEVDAGGELTLHQERSFSYDQALAYGFTPT